MITQEDEMGGACGTYGGGAGEVRTGFWSGDGMERDHLESLGIEAGYY